MTKSFRLSLVALALASTGIMSIESASAAKICRGGLILPGLCSKAANAASPLCSCESLGSDRTTFDDGSGNGSGNGGGTAGGGDVPLDGGGEEGEEPPTDG